MEPHDYPNGTRQPIGGRAIPNRAKSPANLELPSCRVGGRTSDRSGDGTAPLPRRRVGSRASETTQRDKATIPPSILKSLRFFQLCRHNRWCEALDLQLASNVQRTDGAVTAGLGDEVVGILAGFQIPTVWDRNTCGEVTMPVFHTSSSVVEKSRLLESCILPVKKNAAHRVLRCRLCRHGLGDGPLCQPRFELCEAIHQSPPRVTLVLGERGRAVHATSK